VTTTVQSPAAERRNSIGFLRLLFAALVVYVHCNRIGGFEGEFLWTWSGATISAGTLAVQCFFVLSGALIATSWIRSHSLGRFLWHRFLRLAPAFWVCLVVTAFVFTPLLYFHTAEPRTAFFSLEPSAWDYVWCNLLRPRTVIAIGIFPNGGPWAGDWNGSLWTLFYEGACYLFVAALGLAGLLTRVRWLGAIAILGFIALFSFWSATHVAHPAWLPSRVDRLFDTDGKALTVLFLAGSVWAVFPEFTTPLLRSRWWGPLACTLLVVSCRTGFHSVFAPWLLPLVLFWLARVLPFTAFEKQVGGDYSYGLYVYGYPVQQILAHFRVHDLGFYPYLVASLVASTLCAIVSWHLVEKPALSLKNLFSRPTSPLAPA
jgi:peptidoglycan/LPS O-acetylase OafA/YrhL